MGSEVLALYRCILRHGRSQLRLTDQSFFRRMVREEFQKHKKESDPKELDIQMNVSRGPAAATVYRVRLQL